MATIKGNKFYQAMLIAQKIGILDEFSSYKSRGLHARRYPNVVSVFCCFFTATICRRAFHKVYILMVPTRKWQFCRLDQICHTLTKFARWVTSVV